MAEAPEQDDRTEDPTPRRLEQALERGDVAKSTEINTLFVLGGFTLALLVSASPASRSLALDLRGFLANAHLVPGGGAGLVGTGTFALWAGLTALAVPLAMLLLAGFLGGAIQHRPLWTLSQLKPQWSRVSPLSGLKRLLGKEAFAQFVKGLAKIGIVGTVVALLLWNERDRLDAFARLDPAAVLPGTLALAVKLMGGVLAIYAFLALGDAAYQRLTWLRRQRMSKRELKEEYKEMEGSPEVKARLKQIRAARLKKRMMASVPTATVVVANPTHFAVALKYEAGMAAPLCVAKGVDALALRIRAVAEEHRVPIVENPPLARALHASVDVDEEIPVEHYKAVAEVIGYILRLRQRPA
jgi:flagellar biosynthesis protein FlhB